MTHKIAPPFFDNAEVSRQDPLFLDAFMDDLPEINRLGDHEAITTELTNAVDQVIEAPLPDSETLAAMRDLDFLLSSSLRHGVNPALAVPALQPVLRSLGQSALTIPRGTIATYVAVNPNDSRMRTYTGSSEEEVFIEALRSSYTPLEEALSALSSIVCAESDANAIIGTLSQASEAVKHMTRSIVTVHQMIPPQVFTDVIRPYFEPIVIDGQSYAAPGGSQLQLLGLEFMLWGCDSGDKDYAEFFRDNYPYLTPSQRTNVATFSNNNTQSIYTFITEHGKKSSDCAMMHALKDTLGNIRKFRYPHKKVADDNFNLRPTNSVGSGSYTPAMLGHLISQTNQKIAGLRKSPDE